MPRPRQVQTGLELERRRRVEPSGSVKVPDWGEGMGTALVAKSWLRARGIVRRTRVSHSAGGPGSLPFTTPVFVDDVVTEMFGSGVVHTVGMRALVSVWLGGSGSGPVFVSHGLMAVIAEAVAAAEDLLDEVLRDQRSGAAAALTVAMVVKELAKRYLPSEYRNDQVAAQARMVGWLQAHNLLDPTTLRLANARLALTAAGGRAPKERPGALF